MPIYRCADVFSEAQIRLPAFGPVAMRPRTPWGKKIPAVTIHGMSSDWPNILHSSNDQAAKVNSASVYLGYRLALSLVPDGRE